MKYGHFILVGSYGAGKTTALEAISDFQRYGIDNQIIEHSLSDSLLIPNNEHQVIKLNKEQTLYLYSYSTQEDIAKILPTVEFEADGAIILLDHRQSNVLDDLKVYLDLFTDHLDNIVLAVTHVDENPAQLLKKYRNYLAMIKVNLPLFAIDPRNEENIFMLLEILQIRRDVKLV